ncbi:MAG TPA: lysophospholipid acyltransferase family protein, partial [Clostridia bacterium]
METKKYRHSKFFNKLLRTTFGKYLTLRFNVKIFNEEIADIKPPYLVIGNHIGAWDPFLMSLGVKEPIYFVVSDAHFRHFWLSQVLKLVGGIPKAKQLADSGTIRAIISIIKKNGVVGVYPEGARNWDLKNVPVFYATAKLIKNLKVPVINTLMEGAGLTRPRWARSSRTGIINMKYSVLFTTEEINRLSVDDIYQKIVDGIRMNEYDWQEKNMVPFKGRNLAEYLDLFLVVCPRCKSLCSLYSHGDFFTCNNCNYTVRYNEYGYFETEHEPFFLSPQTWSDWQNTYLYELFSKNEYVSGQIPLFSDT